MTDIDTSLEGWFSYETEDKTLMPEQELSERIRLWTKLIERLEKETVNERDNN